MYKRIICCIVLIIFCSGCTANYNLKIDNDSIIEELEIIGIDNSNFNANNIPINYEYDDSSVFETKQKDIEYYSIKKKDNNEVEYTYKYDYDNFAYSTFLHRCYSDVDAYTEGDRFIISTTGDFNCFKSYEDLSNIKINIYSQYKLVDTNANQKDGFNYIWNINENNISDGIYLELDLTKRNNTLQEDIIDSKFFGTLLFIGITIVGAIFYLIFKIISKTKDRI